VLQSADEPAFTRSEAEAKPLALIRKARLPTPEVNARIGGYEVDFLWREQGLVVEVDGFAYHSTRRAFERDRRKDAEVHA
jgi:very-short-patch-repair endonuclease